MDKTIYPKIIEILWQFMDLEVSNNLIWNHPKEFSTQMLKECGYEITDWSWYDGHIVSCNCTEHPQLSINYAACANSYCIFSEEPLDYINVQVEEVGKLASEQKRSKVDFNKITVNQQLGDKPHDYQEIDITNISPEFDNFIKELFKWQKSFDKSEDFDYSITIYIGKAVNVEEL